jgi:hypothetical protein
MRYVQDNSIGVYWVSISHDLCLDDILTVVKANKFGNDDCVGEDKKVCVNVNEHENESVNEHVDEPENRVDKSVHMVSNYLQENVVCDNMLIS